MNFPDILLYSLVAGAAALLGTAILFFFHEWAHKNSVFLISFGAGVMLAIAFLDLIPESAETYGDGWMMVFLGFLLLYVLQNIIMVHPCHDEDCKTHLGVLSTVGLSIHSLLDGIMVSVGFAGGHTLGILTSLAVILHKMPDGITITGILLHSGAEKRKIILYSAFVAALTPVGAVVSYLLLKGVPREVFGALMALTAGSFLYLAAADLLPESHKVRHNGNTVSFFSGIIMVIVISRFLHA